MFNSPIDRVSEWIDWLIVERRSASTVRAYTWEINRLQAYWPDRSILTLQSVDLVAYLAQRRRDGAGDAAIYRAVNALKSFYGHVQGRRTIAKRLPMKRPPVAEHRTLKFGQALDVLAACDSMSPIGLRDMSMQALMLDSGLRAAEVCRLQLAKLDLDMRRLRVLVKGGHEGLGSFSIETTNYLSAWLAVRERYARCDRVFVGFEREQAARGAPLTPDGLRSIFRRIGRSAGLPAYSPHDLRRTFALLFTLMGGPSRVLQEAGRWHDLKLVERYTASLRLEAADPYLPMSGIMGGQ